MAYCTKCGAYIPIGESECPSCGFDPKAQEQDRASSTRYRVIYQKSSDSAFAAAPPQRAARDSRDDLSVKDFMDRLDSLYGKGGFSADLSMMTSMMLGTSSSRFQRIISLIQSYPIPDDRNELYDFLYLANSNINPSIMIEPGYKNTPQRAITEAWINRAEQMLWKAEALYGSDAELLRIRAAYERKIHDIKYETEKRDRTKKRIWCTVAWIFLFPFYPVLVTIQASHNEKLSGKRKTIRIAIAWVTFILFLALPYIFPV